VYGVVVVVLGHDLGLGSGSDEMGRRCEFECWELLLQCRVVVLQAAAVGGLVVWVLLLLLLLLLLE
jgi:hypothetical protein